jgi:hypothetical protein
MHDFHSPDPPIASDQKDQLFLIPTPPAYFLLCCIATNFDLTYYVIGHQSIPLCPNAECDVKDKIADFACFLYCGVCSLGAACALAA